MFLSRYWTRCSRARFKCPEKDKFFLYSAPTRSLNCLGLIEWDACQEPPRGIDDGTDRTNLTLPATRTGFMLVTCNSEPGCGIRTTK